MRATSETPGQIEATQLCQFITDQHHPILIDVRTPAEFEEVHIEGSHLVPLDTIKPATLRDRFGEDETLYFVCGTGKRAATAIRKLDQGGVCNVALVEGGITAWLEKDLPVKRGQKTISLERQVRIAAGLLVLLGVLLGVSVHSAFLILAAFVGAGLTFAGVTDTCGMAMLLAKMPWNRRCSAGA